MKFLCAKNIFYNRSAFVLCILYISPARQGVRAPLLRRCLPHPVERPRRQLWPARLPTRRPQGRVGIHAGRLVGRAGARPWPQAGGPRGGQLPLPFPAVTARGMGALRPFPRRGGLFPLLRRRPLEKARPARPFLQNGCKAMGPAGAANKKEREKAAAPLSIPGVSLFLSHLVRCGS